MSASGFDQSRGSSSPRAATGFPQLPLDDQSKQSLLSSTQDTRDVQIEQLSSLSLRTENDGFTYSNLDSLASNNGISSQPSSPATSKDEFSPVQSKWKTTFEDVRHFAGGLISHPYESTKHYSVLRHSHGLVYYHGSFTNLAITIFSDCPLPENRTLWLQKKGWSGKTGMKAGALLGSKSAWINVTPTLVATADQLPPSDERAWQRDIKKFLEKAPKELKHHAVRETNVLRIPCQADDGYLRVVLCGGDKGKKVLCPSPVFRLASTSTSVSSIKGASLSTLPMELSLKVASSVAKITASNAVAPVAGTMMSQLSPYRPGFLAKKAASAAYGASGVPGKLNNVNQQYENTHQANFQQDLSSHHDSDQTDLAEEDPEPQAPFPVRFTGRITQFSGAEETNMGMPTTNLTNVAEEILLRYEGIYFGWANMSPTDKKNTMEFPDEWLQSIISIIPCPESKTQVVRKKVVKVSLIHEFEPASTFDGKLSLVMMGFLRPFQEDSVEKAEDPDSLLLEIYSDIAIAQASLSRPNWSVESTLERIKSAASNRSLTERYVDLKQSGQKQVDRVPLHKAGIRTNVAGLRDRLVGNGGIRVLR